MLTAARRIGRPDGLAVVHRLHGFIHPDLVRLEVVPGHDTTVLSNGLNDILGDPSVLVALVVLAILSSVKDRRPVLGDRGEGSRVIESGHVVTLDQHLFARPEDVFPLVFTFHETYEPDEMTMSQAELCIVCSQHTLSARLQTHCRIS